MAIGGAIILGSGSVLWAGPWTRGLGGVEVIGSDGAWDAAENPAALGQMSPGGHHLLGYFSYGMGQQTVSAGEINLNDLALSETPHQLGWGAAWKNPRFLDSVETGLALSGSAPGTAGNYFFGQSNQSGSQNGTDYSSSRRDWGLKLYPAAALKLTDDFNLGINLPLGWSRASQNLYTNLSGGGGNLFAQIRNETSQIFSLGANLGLLYREPGSRGQMGLLVKPLAVDIRGREAYLATRLFSSDAALEQSKEVQMKDTRWRPPAGAIAVSDELFPDFVIYVEGQGALNVDREDARMELVSDGDQLKLERQIWQITGEQNFGMKGGVEMFFVKGMRFLAGFGLHRAAWLETLTRTDNVSTQYFGETSYASQKIEITLGYIYEKLPAGLGSVAAHLGWHQTVTDWEQYQEQTGGNISKRNGSHSFRAMSLTLAWQKRLGGGGAAASDLDLDLGE